MTNLKELSGFDINVIRFCFSVGYRAPRLPVLDINEDFYHSRLNELDNAFEELKETVSNIDGSTNKGYEDLLKAVNVSKQLRIYKINLESKYKPIVEKASPVPYTASNKKRLGG